MRSYNVGSWYPCADLFGRIADPKTTVVVGAILCALSSGNLEGINFDAARMRMTSTARYVGELNLQGQLEAAKVWFVVNEDGSVEPEEQTITYHSPITVGYRQLAVDRWPASAYYKLDFQDKTGHGPYKVKVALSRDESRNRPQNDEEPAQAEGTTVKAPLVGTFYAASAPGEAPVVSVGDTAKKGQTLCVLEAMKMMSEVPAPCDCVILEILAKDGDLVGFDAPLFQVREL